MVTFSGHSKHTAPSPAIPRGHGPHSYCSPVGSLDAGTSKHCAAGALQERGGRRLGAECWGEGWGCQAARCVCSRAFCWADYWQASNQARARDTRRMWRAQLTAEVASRALLLHAAESFIWQKKSKDSNAAATANAAASQPLPLRSKMPC